MNLRRLWPLIPMTAGLLVLLTGLAYDVVFAGIPYQDPTPELAAGYARHADTAACLFRSGAAIFVAGLACAFVKWILLRARPSAGRYRDRTLMDADRSTGDGNSPQHPLEGDS